jgi:hypothetical protein
MVVVAVREKGQVDDGDIVDFDGLDHPSPDDGGRLVLVHGDAVVDLQNGILTLLADIKPNGDDGHVLAGHGVDVLHAVDLPEQAFQRSGHQLFDLFGTGPRRTDIDVGQGHHDLRILFPGVTRIAATPRHRERMIRMMDSCEVRNR